MQRELRDQVRREAAEIGRSSVVRIELVKLREYAERVVSACNCVFCEDRIGEYACVCRKSCQSMQLDFDKAGASLHDVASICNVVCFISAKSDGRLHK